MRNSIQIAIVDLRLFLADRTNLVSLLVMPVVMAVLLGGVMGGGGGPSRLRVDMIDQDNSALSQQLIQELRAVNETLVLCPVDDSEETPCFLDDPDEPLTVEQAIKRVEQGTTSALLVIPAGYGEAVQAFEEVSLPYYTLADVTTGDAVLQSVQAVLQRVNGAVVAARIGASLLDRLSSSTDETARQDFAQATRQRAAELWAQQAVTVRYVLTQQGEQEATPTVSGFSQSVPGMATMFVLFNVLGAIGLLLKERKDWTLQRLAVLPLSRAQVLGGKILARFGIGLFEFAILFAVGLFVGLDFGNDLLALLVVVVAYTLCVTALAFAIAPLIRTEGQAGSLSTMLGLVMAALGGAWWPLDIVPETMRIVGHLSPVAWAMDSFNELLFYGGHLGDVLIPVGVLLATAAVFFAFGISRFHFE
mgnify:CR=1 FL=1